uniref:Uncharacterized protein n=1 Tax=Ditylenchus dipsaci TaxID=166011 RepID=A0A915CST2_9BILA
MGIEQNAADGILSQNALNAVPAPVVQAILPAINQDQPEVAKENDTIGFVKSERGKDKAVHRGFSSEAQNKQCGWTLAGEDRTNNYAEAAHRRLQDALGVDHPTVGRLLQDLKRIQRNHDTHYEQYLAGQDASESAIYLDADRKNPGKATTKAI